MQLSRFVTATKTCPTHYISVYVCDVTIVPRIASTAANKLRWRNCTDKNHY